MFFFVNQYLLSNNSSVEHAEIKRLKLFKENKVAAKLVTRDFDPLIHATLQRFGLADQQLVNMFDFFAQATEYQGKELHVEDLHLPVDYQVGTGNNSRDVMDGQRQVAEIYFIGGTVGQVDHLDFYDPAGNLTLRERFDIRGFKAVDQFFGQDGQMHYERYYRPDGTLYLERYYVQSTENTPINSLNVLRDYNGRDRFFDSIDDLFVFFLNELNRTSGDKNKFIADRPAVAIQPVLQMDDSAQKYLWMSINHVDDGQDLLNGPLDGMLQSALNAENISKWDGIIVMTAQQAQNLRSRLSAKVPVMVVNGSPVKQASGRVAMDQRRSNHLIYVGRLGEDKQISQLLAIFASVHQQIPTSTLTLYGYGTAADVDRYKKQAADAKLDSAVTFAGYQLQLDQAYDQAQLFVDASRIDSQPLAMAEALSHGVPVVSYNYLYGPADMVKPGINGELLALNNPGQFAAAIVKLLQDQRQLQRLSNGAYGNLAPLSEETTWQQWLPIVRK